MSEILIRRAHHTSQQKAKKIAEQIAERLAREYQLSSEWEGNTLLFSRSGLQGALAVGDKELSLQVKLGLLMAALKGPIQQAVEAKLDELLAKPTTAAAAKKPTRPASKK